MITLGKTHFASNNTGWEIICGEDKDKILFDRYKVDYTENFKYVTCKKCIKIKEESSVSNDVTI